jgi:heptosyltransferase-1
VVDLQGLFKSGAVAFLTGTKNKIGYWEMREGSGFISKPIKGPHAQDHVIERYLDVARYLGAKVDKITFPLPKFVEESAKIKNMLLEAGLGRAEDAQSLRPYIVLAPGARWETKQWPSEYFAKLAQLFIAEGYPIVLAGSKGDMPLGQAIAQAVGDPKNLVNLVGKTNLSELAALLKDTYFYVSADTGPLHIANAYGKPLIAIYGPTRPDRTGPYGNPKATVLQAQVECAGCLKKHCKDWRCMYSVTPEQVLDVFKQKMEAVQSGAGQ